MDRGAISASFTPARLPNCGQTHMHYGTSRYPLPHERAPDIAHRPDWRRAWRIPLTTAPMRPVSLVPCEDCDLLQRVPPLAPGDRARCPRCGQVIASRPTHSLELPLALAVAAAIVYLIAQTEPLLSLSAVGRHASTTIAGGVAAMWMEGRPITALIVAFCVVIAPAVYLSLVIAALWAARGPHAPHWAALTLRWGLKFQPWAMFEVMLVGVLVALIKIAELAPVTPGLGLLALGALVVLFAAIAVTLDVDEVWCRVEWRVDANPRKLPGAAQ